MSRDHAWNHHNRRSTGICKWLEIILLILIGLMIFILAFQAITYKGRSHAIKYGHVESRGELAKILFKTH